MTFTNNKWRIQINHDAVERHFRPKPKQVKMKTLHYTFSTAIEPTLILLICEDKAKNYVRDALENHLKKSSYITDPKIKEMADIMSKVLTQYEDETSSNLSYEDQCRFADICQMYDDRLDGVLKEIEKSIAGHLHTNNFPEETRPMFSKIYGAGYACLLTIGIHNYMREIFPFLMFLGKKMISGEEFKTFGETLDKILYIILDGKEIEFLDSQLYKSLDKKFTTLITDNTFLVNSANSVGFNFEIPSEEDVEKFNQKYNIH